MPTDAKDKWQEAAFSKHFQDVGKEKLVEAQKQFLQGGGWSSNYSPLNLNEAMALLKTKSREISQLISDKTKEATSTFSMWSNFFRKEKDLPLAKAEPERDNKNRFGK